MLSKMSKSDKTMFYYLGLSLLVLIVLGVVFGVSSVKESFGGKRRKKDKKGKKRGKKEGPYNNCVRGNNPREEVVKCNKQDTKDECKKAYVIEGEGQMYKCKWKDDTCSINERKQCGQE
tara:strand:+ start:331 stop:687 length:357 start_codon:yes stop_codon:yes gene_type:complete